MGFQPLQKWNGVYHLPFPKGRYLVGMTDLQTKDNLLVRCFYPTQKIQTQNDHYSNSNLWCKWLPSLEYADGYLRFKFSKGIPLMARFFRFLLGDPVCPIATNATVTGTEKPMPVVIFSHGLGAMRSSYSILLTELASNGYFVAAVEHKDGSASSTQNTDGSWTFNRSIKEGESEYDVRNDQVNQRVRECESTFHLLSKVLKEANLDLFHPQPPSNFIESVRAARLDLDRNCFISGHSFGGATALKSIITSKLNGGEPMFKKALLYDTWMFPLRYEAEQLSKEGQASCVHFINCERFQGLKNIETMRHFEKDGNIVTLRDTQHYAPCDIPTVMMGSWLKKPFSMLFRLEDPTSALPAHKALDVCCDIAVRFFDDLDYLQNIEDGYIYRGTSYMSS